jgi:hypothetical protein
LGEPGLSGGQGIQEGDGGACEDGAYGLKGGGDLEWQY